MRTTLTPERLATLHAQGRAEAGRSPFVDPCAAAQSKRILQVRGESWAASVLMRDLSRRSIRFPALPWFEDGELEILVLADQAEKAEEWEQITKAVQNPMGQEGDLA